MKRNTLGKAPLSPDAGAAAYDGAAPGSTLASSRADRASVGPARSSRHVAIVKTLWRRDMLRFKAERSRWMGAVLQPLIFWAMIGFGMGSHFQGAVPAASGAAGTVAANADAYVQYFFPGSLVMVVLFTAMFASMSIIEDRNTGFLQSVLVIPGARVGVLAGKIASVTTLAVLQVGVFLAASPLAGLSFANFSWGSLLFTVVTGTAGLSALSLAGAWILNSVHGYHAVMGIVLFPLWILSGAMFPMVSGWQWLVGLVNPLSYFVGGVRVSLSGGSLADAAHLSTAVGLAAVVVVTSIAAFLALRRTGVQAV